MLTRILLAALLAGVLSGVFASAVQSVRVTPLILQAETYENAGSDSHAHNKNHAGDHSNSNSSKVPAIAEEVWAPKDGMERTMYTVLSNILVGVSFALILTAGVLLTKSALTLRSGLVWGVCGFVAFVLAPNFGLPPELPGMPAADLTTRQNWWFATVIATGAALLVFAFKRHWAWMVLGLVLLVAPHIYGAPQPLDHHTLVPANLAAQFAIATVVTSFLFWMFLGGVLGWLISRVSEVKNS